MYCGKMNALENTLDTLFLSSKKFHSLSLSTKLANFTVASLVSLHYNIYKDRVKLADFKISPLDWQRWQKLVLMNTFCV